MGCNNTVGILPVFSAGIFLLFAVLLCPNITKAEVVIIANPSVSINSISKDELKEIFTGKLVTWNNGQAIKPALLTKGEAHEEFIQDYVGKTTNQFTTYWRKMIFTGQGIQPLTFNTPGEVIEYVAKTPGAIGYVSPSDTPNETKTLPVAGQ
jgi:ABC-type phosphate transport system substrate-binding protein